jgi:hedgehog interacting protein
LAQDGVHSVCEAQRYLELFVQCDLFKGCRPPDKTSRRFYPTNKDIYNHLYKGKPNHFSSVDQKNLEELVQKWKTVNPQVFFLYRPHSSKLGEDESVADVDDNSFSDDSEEITQTLLFCHQTRDQ